MSDILLGIRVGYDGKAVTGGAPATTEQLRQIGETGKKAGAEASRALDYTAMSAKQTAAALRGVPAQFTDIVTAIASGQAPLTVLIQQGGQLKDMFGGVGPAARALGGYVAGLVNPYAVAAAAVAGLAYAYHAGSKESDAYTRSLILSGNAAGATAAQMADAARRVAATTGATQGAAAEALALGISGGIPGASLAAVAEAALRMQQVTGKAIDDTVTEFAKLAREPVAASKKLDEQYNYLTASTYRQIKAFQDQGRGADAAALAMKAYADAIAERTGEITQNLGWIEGKWLGLKAAAKGAVDSLFDIGRPDDALGAAVGKYQEKLATLAEWRRKAAAPGLSGIDARLQLPGLEKELEVARAAMVAARDKANAGNLAAAAKAKANAEEKAGIDLSREADKFATRQVQMKRELAHVEGLYAASAKTAADVEARRAAIAGIREKYADKKVDNGLDDAAREQARSYAQQYEAAAKLARGIEAEAAAGEKLLPVEKALAEARATLTDAQMREIELALAGPLLIERRTRAEKEAAAAAKVYTESLRQQISPIEERARQLAEERENAGKTETEIAALTIARLEEARATAAANGALAEHLDFYDRLIDAHRGVRAELALNAEAQASWITGARAAMTEYARTVEDRAGQTKRAWSSTWKRAEDDLTTLLSGGKVKVSDFARHAIAEFQRISIAQPLMAKLAGFANGAIDKMFSSSGTGYAQSAAASDAMTSMWAYPNAKGNVFDSPDLHQYVNTVVDRPTFFRFAKGGALGVAGEVPGESEGILPLKRDKQGRLGVIAEGAGGGGVSLHYAPVFEIDARGAAVGVGPMLQGVVDAAVSRSRAELLAELANGGAFASATGRRRA